MSRLLILIVLVSLAHLEASAETTISADAGEYSENILAHRCAPCAGSLSIVPLRLNNSDPAYAPMTAVIVYSIEGIELTRFGIYKTEGAQGLTTFINHPATGRPVSIQANRELGNPIALHFEVSPSHTKIQVGTQTYAFDLGFPLGKVVHIVSGMDARVTIDHTTPN